MRMVTVPSCQVPFKNFRTKGRGRRGDEGTASRVLEETWRVDGQTEDLRRVEERAKALEELRHKSLELQCRVAELNNRNWQRLLNNIWHVLKKRLQCSDKTLRKRLMIIYGFHGFNGLRAGKRQPIFNWRNYGNRKRILQRYGAKGDEKQKRMWGEAVRVSDRLETFCSSARHLRECRTIQGKRLSRKRNEE